MKKWVVGLLIIAAVAVGYFSFRWFLLGGGSRQVNVKNEQLTNLPVVKVDPAIRADGKIVPARSIGVTAQTAGVVSQVLVKEGQQVKVGQVLLRLDNSRQELAVTQAEAVYAKAKARLEELMASPRPHEVASAEAALQAAKTRLARLSEDGAPLDVAMTSAEMKSAQAQLDLVKAGTRPEALASAKADVTSAEAALRQARLNLADTEIRAAFTGVVAALKVNSGEAIAANAVLMRLYDAANWQVETSDLTEMAVVKIKVGDKAVVTCDALKDTLLPGVVKQISNYGENRSGDIVYTVLIALERQEPRLYWNMTATVKITSTR